MPDREGTRRANKDRRAIAEVLETGDEFLDGIAVGNELRFGLKVGTSGPLGGAVARNESR